MSFLRSDLSHASALGRLNFPRLVWIGGCDTNSIRYIDKLSLDMQFIDVCPCDNFLHQLEAVLSISNIAILVALEYRVSYHFFCCKFLGVEK